MYVHSLSAFFLVKKACRIYRKRTGIKLTESLLLVIYAIYIIHPSELTYSSIREKIEDNCRYLTGQAITNGLAWLVDNKYITGEEQRRRAFTAIIYAPQPSFFHLIHSFEKTLRKTRHDY